jgi:hypothetical protein
LLDLDFREFFRERLKLYSPPAVEVLGMAYIAQMSKRPGKGRDFAYGDRATCIRRVGNLLCRISAGPDCGVQANDLLGYLKRQKLLCGARPMRLFRPESNEWLLPSSANALWVATGDRGATMAAT